MAIEKVIHWYFVIIEKGKEQITSYGDSRKYTQQEALDRMLLKYPNCRIASKEDMNRLL